MASNETTEMDEDPYRSPESVEFQEPSEISDARELRFSWRLVPPCLFWLSGAVSLFYGIYAIVWFLMMVAAPSLEPDPSLRRFILRDARVAAFFCFTCGVLLATAGFLTWKRRWIWASLAFALTCFVVWVYFAFYAIS